MKVFLVPFEGAEFPLIADDDGRFYVPVKPICDAIGANWAVQAHKLHRGDNYKSKVMTIRALDARDDVIVLPIMRLFGWLRSFHNGLAKYPEAQIACAAFQDRFVDLIGDYEEGLRPDLSTVTEPLDDRDWRFAAIEARLDRLERAAKRRGGDQ